MNKGHSQSLSEIALKKLASGYKLSHKFHSFAQSLSARPRHFKYTNFSRDTLRVMHDPPRPIRRPTESQRAKSIVTIRSSQPLHKRQTPVRYQSQSRLSKANRGNSQVKPIMKFTKLALSPEQRQRARVKAKVDAMISKRTVFWQKMNRKLMNYKFLEQGPGSQSQREVLPLVGLEAIKRAISALAQEWLLFHALQQPRELLLTKLMQISEAKKPPLSRFLRVGESLKMALDQQALLREFQIIKPPKLRLPDWTKLDLDLHRLVQTLQYKLAKRREIWVLESAEQKVTTYETALIKMTKINMKSRRSNSAVLRMQQKLTHRATQQLKLSKERDIANIERNNGPLHNLKRQRQRGVILSQVMERSRVRLKQVMQKDE